jgi:hypothetical protein
MPRKEINDYSFYKIVCLDKSVELCYVGSTANLKARNHTHKSNCNNENSKAYNSKIYKTIRENGGWDNFKMIEIGKREQLRKREAEQIEEEYRQELKANLNTLKCFRTEEQKQQQMKKNNKKYRINNKDKIKENYENNKEERKAEAKEYYKKNKEKKKEYDKKRNELKKEEIKEKKKQYYQENKEEKKAKAKEYYQKKNRKNLEKIEKNSPIF